MADWRSLPGAEGVAFCPLLGGRDDVFTSNSFVLAGEGYVMVIDPGTDKRRIEWIATAVRAELERRSRPVMICLTHCHWDHSANVERLRALFPGAVELVAHHSAAGPLAAGDNDRTVAFLYFEDSQPTEVTVPLFGVDRELPAPFRLERDEAVCRLFVGAELSATFYALPGHCPDSVAVNAGDCLFLGDVLFATLPGVVGLPGWDRAALLGSIERLRGLLERNPGWTCHPGHGPPLSAAEVLALLPKLDKAVANLGELATLDSERAEFVNLYAKVLLGEADRLFSVLAAKMMRVGCQLELLGEERLAAEILASLDFRKVDAVFASFHSFARNEATGKLRTELAMRAVRLMRKIDALFQDELWLRRVDDKLVQRLKRLFSWFMEAIQGHQMEHDGAEHDLGVFVAGLVASFGSGPELPEEYLDVAGDSEAFLRCLVGNLGVSRGLFASCEVVSLDLSGGSARARFDAQRLGDALTSAVEAIAAAGTEKIELVVEPGPRLRVKADGDAAGNALRSELAEFFKLTMRGHGAGVKLVGREVVIDFKTN